MRRFKILACCAAMLAVTALLPSAVASGGTVPSSAGIAQIDGPYMFVHEVTGTYLMTDNYNDNVNETIQTWNQNPPQNTPGLSGHKWYLTASTLGTYRIESFDNRRCLTASAVTAVDHPRLQTCDGGLRQNWHVLKVFSVTDRDVYTITPQEYPEYALGILGNNPVNNWYVVPTPTWGGEPTYSQHWQVILTEEP